MIDFPTWLAPRLDTAKRVLLLDCLAKRGITRSQSAITAWIKGRGTPEPECLPSFIDALALTPEEATELYHLCGVPLHPQLFARADTTPDAAESAA